MNCFLSDITLVDRGAMCIRLFMHERILSRQITKLEVEEEPLERQHYLSFNLNWTDQTTQIARIHK